MRIPRRESEKARIEVIPMIDIVFFLLVFFMISTLSMTVNRSLPVDLPKAASTQQELGETANLTVTKDGALFLNKEPVTLQEMVPKLKAELAVLRRSKGEAGADEELREQIGALAAQMVHLTSMLEGPGSPIATP